MILRLAILALLPVCAGAVFAGAFFYFYQGRYAPPAPVDIPFQEITAPAAPSRPFTDSPATQVQRGLLLVDALHVNGFTEDELTALRSLVADRGYDVEFVGDFDAGEAAGEEGVPEEGAPEGEVRLESLTEKLRRADSFVVILPQAAYSGAEAAVVERFVRKGGKLLLVSDPSRPQRLNSLAERFGLDFQPDYLYNVTEYDANFRHILVRDFQPDQLTLGLDAIALDIAGSIESSGPRLAFASSETESSVLDTGQRLSPITWGDSRNVLAIADFSFMVPPSNSLLDNGRLMSNIADYLTDSERTFDLADFPYFYRSGPSSDVDILTGQPSLLNIGLRLKNGLATHGVASRISAVEDLSRDTVFLGLYQDAPRVSQYLQAAGVSVGGHLGDLVCARLGVGRDGHHRARPRPRPSRAGRPGKYSDDLDHHGNQSNLRRIQRRLGQ